MWVVKGKRLVVVGLLIFLAEAAHAGCIGENGNEYPRGALYGNEACLEVRKGYLAWVRLEEGGASPECVEWSVGRVVKTQACIRMPAGVRRWKRVNLLDLFMRRLEDYSEPSSITAYGFLDAYIERCGREPSLRLVREVMRHGEWKTIESRVKQTGGTFEPSWFDGLVEFARCG